jgi:hypothetical protein
MNAKMTIFELVDAKVSAEAKLYQDAFDLGRYAGEAISKTEYEGIASALGDGEARKVQANDMHNAALELRDELLAKTLKVNEEFDRVKQQRQEALEEAIDPEDVGTGELLQAAMASSEQLTSMADLALSIDHEDGVLLALRVARQNGLEEVEAHIRTVRPDLGDICAELDFIEEVPDYDPNDVESRFEVIARGVPSREELLNMIG